MKWAGRRPVWLVLGLAIALGLPALQWAQESERPAAPAFQSFRVVAERNIFDPNRGAARSNRDLQQREDPPPVESVSLVGAVIHDSTVVAVFTGSRSEYDTTVKPGGTVAGYVVADIRTSGVSLEREGKRVDLPVGAHLSRVGEGEWQMAYGPAPESRRRPPDEGGGNSGTSASLARPSSPPAGAPDSEAMRRLLERRQREEGQ